MTTPIDISVILPTYNRAEMLRGALENLVTQETQGRFAYELVVVDNGSTDATAEVLRQVSANSPIPIRAFRELDEGVAQARNRAVRESRGHWLAFIDDDELAQPDWLAQLHAVALSTGSPCIGGDVHLAMDTKELSSYGPVRRRSFRERIGTDKNPIRLQGRQLPGTDNVLYARHLFDSVGLFDTSMMRGSSDHDFAMRVQAAGHPMWHTSRAIVKHRIPPERRTIAQFRHTEEKTGASLADFDYRYHGPFRLYCCGMARLGQALLLNLPLLCWARIRQNQLAVIDRRALLWRATAYIRQMLTILAPRLIRQDRFLQRLDFRKGREIGNIPMEQIS
jgi:succinoglycan biosynthesis protein ExoM